MTKILLSATLAAVTVFAMTAGAEAKMKHKMMMMMHKHHHGASCKGAYMFMDMKAHKCADARNK